MASPTLLLRLPESTTKRQLLEADAAARFAVTELAFDADWIEEIAAFDLAIIDATDFTEANLQALIDLDVLDTVELILISDGTPNTAIDDAMAQGVAYHMREPIDVGYVLEIMNEFQPTTSPAASQQDPSLQSELDQFGLLLGSSRPMRKLFRSVRKAASTDVSILIVGESGAGKELVANTLHLMSERRDQPMLTINCGALSPELIESELFGHVKGAFTGASDDRTGIFEQADGGTLLLDEITEMPLEQQVKLLRVLESGEYRRVGSNDAHHADVRVIAATNRDPAHAIRDNFLREDVYFRLAEFRINVPPLRDRQDDLPGLAHHFLAYRNAEANSAVVLDETALSKIEDHDWPGNVRELKQVIERAFVLADGAITADDIVLDAPTGTGKASADTGQRLEDIEREAILRTLKQQAGNRRKTAEQLGISVKTLYNKLEKYREAGTDTGEA